ncbi:MAG: DUF2993 domain-containing protein [Bacteroidota bacterium]
MRVAAILLFAVAASGCDLTGRVEAEIARGLPRAIGPAERYDVEVEGLQVTAGAAERVTVVGERVRRAGVPVFDRLDLELTGVRYDRGDRVLERVEQTTAVVRVRPDDLAAFLDTRRGVRSASVRVEAPDRVVLRLRPEAGGWLPEGVAAEITGRLGAERGRVVLDVERVRAGGIGLGGIGARAVRDLVNPVLDLTEADPALDVAAVSIEAGAVVVEATADLDGLVLR